MSNNDEIKYPVKIAEITSENEIIWNLDEFQKVLKLTNGRPLRFVVIIGGYQNGKTSFIALTLGNKLHKIGDEETDGVYIDGLLTVREIAQKWNLNEFQSLDKDELIFFIDIEGFNGQRRGETDTESQIFFTKLSTPFISISVSIHAI